MSMELVMPRAGLTMVEGTISAWLVQEGAAVQKGDTIMEFENEKNTIEFASTDRGFLHITAAEGETVAVGAPIAVLAATKEEYDSLITGTAPAAPAVPVAAEAPAAPQQAPAAAVAAPAPAGEDWRIRATASFHLHIGTHPYHGAPLGYHLFAAFQIAYDNGKSAALNFITHRSYPPCFIVMLLIPVRPACSLSELAPVLLRSSWSSVGTGRYQFGFWCFAPDSGIG